jgi:ribosomal protein L11 methyltransferase
MKQTTKQIITLWQISLDVPLEAVLAFEEQLAGPNDASSCFEIDEGKTWQIAITSTQKPDTDKISTIIANISRALNIAEPHFNITELVEKNWLEEVKRSFPAFRIGRFYIHGSHIGDAPPISSIPIMVDAGMAFGSGEHETTSGCLAALQIIHKKSKFIKALDMGCGSGILAIGAKKLNKSSRLTAADIDPVSVRVTAANVKHNRLLLSRIHGINVFASNGYKNPRLRAQGRFDLILSNILARPLMRNAGGLKRHLKPGGYAVLAGLLTHQANMVLWAHRQAGLKQVLRIQKGNWSILVLQRNIESDIGLQLR